MKKISSTVLVAVFAFASSAVASINVSWRQTQGLFFNDAVAAGNQISADFYHVLIWSPSAPPQMDYALPGTGVGAGEIVLDVGNAGVLGGQFNYSAQVFTDSDVGDVDINAGYLYARIFQFSTVSDGDVYWQTPVSLVQGPSLTVYDPNTEPPDPAQLIHHVVRDTAGGLAMDASNPDMFTVIPEPSVFAMLGLGGLFLALRRRYVA